MYAVVSLRGEKERDLATGTGDVDQIYAAQNHPTSAIGMASPPPFPFWQLPFSVTLILFLILEE